MLRQLYIKNFALIKELRIDFKSGLNIITGETGSGKSIMIDALSLCLGKRGDKFFVKKGETKCEVEAVFSIENKDVIKNLEKYNLDIEDDLIIYREISEEGRSIARINGRTVNLSTLKEVSKYLLNIHGQNEHDNLMDSENQLKLLDEFGGETLITLKEKYLSKYGQLQKLLDEIRSLKVDKSQDELIMEKEFLIYIINDIKDGNINEDELEKLEDRITILNNSGKIFNAIESSYNNLYNLENDALSKINKSIKSLDSISSIYPSAEVWKDKLEDIYYQVEDLAHEINGSRDEIIFDEDELNTIHERISFINKIYRKYGGNHSSMLLELEKAEHSLEQIENISSIKESLTEKLAELKKELDHIGQELTNERYIASINFSKLIINEMKSLSMENVDFKIEFEKVEYKVNGLDKIDFKVTFNKGEELKSFSKVASGGEVSRFVLGLKSIISKYDDIDTMLFDEIDIGVSGLAAENIGKKMKEIAKFRQVLCITHLPQIASCADLHYEVLKIEENDAMHTSIIELRDEERAIEIAKMMSGSKLTELAIRNAEELLNLNKEV